MYLSFEVFDVRGNWHRPFSDFRFQTPLPSCFPFLAMNPNSSQQQPQPPRCSPKVKSTYDNSQKWKDSLRRDCIERAKSARRERLRRQRSNGASAVQYSDATQMKGAAVEDSQRMKRDREDHDSTFDYCEQPLDYEFATHPENDAIREAKALVEQQLQQSMMGLRHCQQILPLDGTENVSKRMMRGSAPGDVTVDCPDLDLDPFSSCDEECKMSEEEYLELINAVTEELEREGELKLHFV